jgi:hypothetical protein
MRRLGSAPRLAILKIVTTEIDSSSDSCRAVRAPLNLAIWSARVSVLEG